MDIKVKGVRKKSKILIEVENWTTHKKFIFWRTDKKYLTREYLKTVGLDVGKDGAITRIKSFGIRDWRKT